MIEKVDRKVCAFSPPFWFAASKVEWGVDGTWWPGVDLGCQSGLADVMLVVDVRPTLSITPG